MIGIVPAAGIGQRMQSAVPKQYLHVAGQYILDHSISALLRDSRITHVVVAIQNNDTYYAQSAAAKNSRVYTVAGGASRAQSVLNALHYARQHWPDETLVAVHDAARPGLPVMHLRALLDVAETHPEQGALLALPARDTLKIAAAGQKVEKTLDRSRIWQAQTPQVFQLGALEHALVAALEAGIEVTDECSAMEYMGARPRLVMGSRAALKVTDPEDLALVEFYLQTDITTKGV
ncbi:2-C-methyl-D-erythritol 4-phosphate cytidylyltransferase [Aliidiomarina halalkaliphila]|uniref:2-C-methyl-D-erythritol 4-phosphate cytidylyltransferase n=1 Tax=Aliidiomarina halalkaliphila TaxID=2593535 RepID=A0A552X3J8_9GAMM|nr:2-C-methyl-D-erythritol 4-phosphate cytidylyltransferase [Aliidiomarina halalkaliphila]TRW49610.1 2-C-methyl-D-erythritol 4-phosphate cytidylyltransferase [Aliidiomarina halalkaliphila]